MNGTLLELNLTRPVAVSCSPADSIHNDGPGLFPQFPHDPYARSKFSKKREKVCSRCNQLLPINQFRTKPRGNGRLKVCHACYALLKTKVCVKCKTRLPFSKFPKAKTKGHWRVCFDCVPSMSNSPCPHIRCAQCLFSLGFGYNRIAIKLFGSLKRKKQIAEWRKRHRWKSDLNHLHCAVRAKFPPKPPKPPKPDPLYLQKRKRLKVYLRRKLWCFFKHGLHPKSTAKLIGCDRHTLRRHISRQFQPGMTFENYGPVWHLDHISPCKLYNLFDLQDRLACFHYTNLQPMFSRENKRKSAKGSRQLFLTSTSTVPKIPVPVQYSFL